MNVIFLNTTTSMTINQIVTFIFTDQCTWRPNSSLRELVCRFVSGAPLTETPFNSTDVIFCCRCLRFLEGYDSICKLCHDFKLDFVRSALISCEHTTIHNFAPTCFFVFFFTPESTLTHTMPIAVSALLNILQHKALIRTLFLSSGCTKTRRQTGFASPKMLLCPMAMDSFVVLRAVM